MTTALPSSLTQWTGMDIELHQTNTMVVVGVVVWWFFCSFALPCLAFCNVLITICVHLYRFSTSCTLFSTEIVYKVHICSTDVDLRVIFHQNRTAVQCRISYVISVNLQQNYLPINTSSTSHSHPKTMHNWNLQHEPLLLHQACQESSSKKRCSLVAQNMTGRLHLGTWTIGISGIS